MISLVSDTKPLRRRGKSAARKSGIVDSSRRQLAGAHFGFPIRSSYAREDSEITEFAQSARLHFRGAGQGVWGLVKLRKPVSTIALFAGARRSGQLSTSNRYNAEN